MDRRLQERLVGGAVVVAAAIVFIPELLSGSKHDAARPEAANVATDGATRTYTIDLEHKSSPRETAPTTESNEANAPPPEMPAGSPIESSPQPTNSPASNAEKRPAEMPAPVTPPRAEEPPRPVAATSEAERTKPQPPSTKKPAHGTGWAVQVGSFGTAASAERIAQQFEQKGFSAYTQPVHVGAKTLYRVRLGPTPERSEAEAILKKVKADQPSAALVSEP